MGSITHLETISAQFAPYGADIQGLDFQLVGSDATITIAAGTGSTGRYMSFQVDGALSLSDSGFIGNDAGAFATFSYDTRDLSLSDWWLADQMDAVANGSTEGWTHSHANTGFFGDSVVVGWSIAGGETWAITSHPDQAGLVVFQFDGVDSFTNVFATNNVIDTTLSDISTIDAFGKHWVIGTSAEDDVISVHSLNDDGSLNFHSHSGVANGVWIGTPVAQSMFEIEGQPFVLVASEVSSSLSVLRLRADGVLVPVDHVIDDLGTRFADTQHVETVTIDGTVFAVASGSDDGFSVFQVRADGHLLLRGTVEDTDTVRLEDIAALDVGNVDGALHIFAASATEPGVSHFSFDPGTLGQTISGTPVGDTLNGTAYDDILMGGAGDDTLNGSAGDDVIVDGYGSDTLTGGAGADIFVFDFDGEGDTITDFEAAKDALDLTYFPLLYDINDLDFQSTVTGARITFGTDVITIFSHNGNSLTANDVFAKSPFGLTRTIVTLPGDQPVASEITILGSNGQDMLVGTPGADYYSGEGGSDTLIGSDGADSLYGGDGFDLVDYSMVTGPITVDLADPAANAGAASGDLYFSMEGIRGSSFGDDLRGSDAADYLGGGDGQDILFGRNGNDALLGGDGDDTLNGGIGADVLNGGAGIDTASYIDGVETAYIDLGNSSQNSGAAMGDVLIDIENVSGTGFADVIWGNGLDNQLLGNDGRDFLAGGAGNDALTGGAGDDFLSGGSGDDALIGGSGFDFAAYAGSKTGVTANLGDQTSNTADAAGDTYDSVENLVGTAQADVLAGDTGANAIFGNLGDDQLSGLGGNDTLNGGYGNDRLDGGDGDDDLIGGTGQDVFVFHGIFGSDRINDFDPRVDAIEIEQTVLDALATTAEQFLDDHASVQGNDIYLDLAGFGDITLDGITDIGALGDVFDFV